MELPKFLEPWTKLQALAPPGNEALHAPAGMAGTAGAPAHTLQFLIQEQHEDYWCWAAVAASISAYFNSATSWTQCKVATAVLVRPCCTDPTSCNVPRALDDALHYTGNLAHPLLAGKLSQSGVQAQIDSGCPIGCHLKRTAGVDHFVVLHGYDWVSGDVAVADPLTGEFASLPWSEFTASSSSIGLWDATCLTRR
jgi:hypothetical protein